MEAIFLEYRRMLTAHPNMMPFAGRRIEGDPDSGLVYLTQLGFAEDDAVELWQSVVAFTVGYSVFSTEYAASDTYDLPPGLAARMSDWRDETCARTLRMIIESYDALRKSRQAKPRRRAQGGRVLE